MTFAESVAATPPHVRVVLDALIAVGAKECAIIAPGEDQPHWKLSWGGEDWYAEIETYEHGVEWFASAGATADYTGTSERDPGPLPESFIGWLRKFGVIA